MRGHRRSRCVTRKGSAFIQETQLQEDRLTAAGTFDISVIVPVCEMSANFALSLQAIARLDPPPREVVIAIDGEDAEVAAAAREIGAVVTGTARRLGPAAARNAGAETATGEILFFVDADVAVPEGALATVRAAFTGPDAPDAIVGSYDTSPPAANFSSQYKNLLQHFVHQEADDRICTFWGACGAIRRDVFLAVNGFDARYDKPSIEDIELGYRLSVNGYAIRMVKALQVTHLKRWSAGDLFVSDVFRRALPWSRLILSEGRIDDVLNINRTERIKVVLAGLLLAQLAAGVLFRPALWSAPVTAVVLGIADARLLRFFCRERGALFAGRALARHWLYYLYSGVAFGSVLVQRGLGRLPKRTEAGWPPDWDQVL